MTLTELRKSMFEDKTLLTEAEVRQIMKAYSAKPSSGRLAAISLKINTTYWSQVLSGKMHIGKKIQKECGVKRVYMYEVVDEQTPTGA